MTFNHFGPGDDLAKKINEQVSVNHLDEAYATMKSGLTSIFSTETLAEKQATWAELSASLLSKDNQSMPKMAACWLAENATKIAGKDGQISKDELTSVAEHAIDPLYKGMATEMLKQFDTASKLKDDDGTVSVAEAEAFKARQNMEPLQDFTDKLIKATEQKAATSPAQAYQYLQDQIYARSLTETSEEKVSTWKQVSEQLYSHNLVPKLAMGFLDVRSKNIDTNNDLSISLPEITKFTTNNINPLTKELGGFVIKEFPNIGTIDYKLDEISPEERKLYKQKIMPTAEK